MYTSADEEEFRNMGSVPSSYLLDELRAFYDSYINQYAKFANIWLYVTTNTFVNPRSMEFINGRCGDIELTSQLLIETNHPWLLKGADITFQKWVTIAHSGKKSPFMNNQNKLCELFVNAYQKYQVNLSEQTKKYLEQTRARLMTKEEFTEEESDAVLHYLGLTDAKRNTLLAFQVLNWYAKKHGIRVEDAIVVLKEYLDEKN